MERHQFRITIDIECKRCGKHPQSKKECKQCGASIDRVYETEIVEVDMARIVVGPDTLMGPMA